ncbi:MAG: NAD(P)H-binding protein [Nitriliruptorales bacterium]|nr:NAD(P)H-binding protein [Nitriliruptorales bacterium]
MGSAVSRAPTTRRNRAGRVSAVPVLITGAETAEGRATARRFLRGGGEVRVFVDPAADRAAEDFRTAGCKIALGTLDDEGHLETAAEQVHTVVHVGGGPMTAPTQVLDDTATVLSAAIGAGCRRLIWVSHVGAGDPRGNGYLQACAETEAMLADAPLESIIVRRALTYGPGDPLTLALSAGALPRDAEESTHQPLYVDDLALVLARADHVRGSVGDLSIEVTLTGPTEVLLSGFADLLAAPNRDRDAVPPLPRTVADLLARDLVIDDAMVGPTDIPQGLERLTWE